jgi:hypothetical protein
MLYQRIAELGPGHMPPLATSVLDHDAIALVAQWITNIAPVLLEPLTPANDHFLLRFTGNPDRWYRLQSSLRLGVWSATESVRTDATGAASHPVEPGTNSAQFYRVVWP